MRTFLALTAIASLSFLAACATTEYKPYEAKDNLFEGKGGTKVVVDGMEIWDNGDPPRRFKVLDIIDDERPGGLIPMSQLWCANPSGRSTSWAMHTQSINAGYRSGTTLKGATLAQSILDRPCI
jgi:hypothetical protein